MQINPQLIKQQFKKSMDKYGAKAIVQKNLAIKLVDELMEFGLEFDTILELGCGTGFLTQEIAEKLNFSTYYTNDLIEQSKKYVDKILPENIFICGNAQRIKPPKNMDLIVSNAMFQWFTSLEKISEHYSKLLNKQGILAFSTFAPENFCEIRDLTGLSLKYKTVAEIEKEISGGFRIIKSLQYQEILEFNTPLELLAHMKNTGVNSLSNSNLTFKEVKKFCDNYKEKFPQITLTYVPMIIIAQKI
ncbi:MAG: malonyl-ACP O-methyltransferase BioC [Candidatus Gastranaerophilales bacterium]